MSITTRLKEIRATLPEQVRLVAVSKFHPPEVIREAYNAGQRIYGESRVQELLTKYESLPRDIEWHFIGHLQTNKVRYIVPFISLIESVDSIRLLDEIEKQAGTAGRKIPVLLQVHIAREEQKFGFAPDEVEKLLLSPGLEQKYRHIRFSGLMGMATFTDDHVQIAQEFKGLAELFQRLKGQYRDDSGSFSELSMGMSDDYLLAIEKGSTSVRIGSKIFGIRE